MPRVLQRVLERLDADGTHDALLGDVLEELSQGRSRLWAWQQILALGAVTAVQSLRRAALRPNVIVMAPGVSLLSACWLAPVPHVLASWAAVYFLSGALSLALDFASSSTDDWNALGSQRTRQRI